MKFLALMGGIAALNSKYANDLHEEMESFINIVEAIETHDQETVYDAIAARKESLAQTMDTKDAKTVT